MHISILAAVERSSLAIGANNKLLWRLPKDMARFVEIRTGKPVVMGRKTWESIPEKFRPLQGSPNIVISRNPEFEAHGALVSRTFSQAMLGAFEIARRLEKDEVVVIGGGVVYRAAFDSATRLYLTLVDDPTAIEKADTFFPSEYKDRFKRVVHSEEVMDGKEENIRTEFVILERM